MVRQECLFHPISDIGPQTPPIGEERFFKARLQKSLRAGPCFGSCLAESRGQSGCTRPFLFLPRHHRPVPRNLRLEITQAVPLLPRVEVDFRRHDGSPLLRPDERAALVIVHGREHPVA